MEKVQVFEPLVCDRQEFSIEIQIWISFFILNLCVCDKNKILFRIDIVNHQIWSWRWCLRLKRRFRPPKTEIISPQTQRRTICVFNRRLIQCLKPVFAIVFSFPQQAKRLVFFFQIVAAKCLFLFCEYYYSMWFIGKKTTKVPLLPNFCLSK